MRQTLWWNKLTTALTSRSERRNRLRRRPISESIDSLELRTLLAAVMWDGGGGDFNWNNANNWSGDTLPGTDDDVTINLGTNDFTVVHSFGTDSIKSLVSHVGLTVNGGSLTTVAASHLFGMLTVSATFGGSGDTIVDGTFTWGGTLQGANGGGSLTANGGTTITGGALTQGFHYLNPSGQTATLVGSINMNNTSLFENAGTLDIPGDADMSSTDLTSEFLNSGLLIKSGGAAGDAASNAYTWFIPGVFSNTGTIDLRVGNLSLGNWGSSGRQVHNSGSITGLPGTFLWLYRDVESSGSIDVDGIGTYTGTTSISGPFSSKQMRVYNQTTLSGPVSGLGDVALVGGGLLNISSATLTASARDLTNLSLGGTLISSDALTVSGTFTWGGTLQGANGGGSLTLLDDTIMNSVLTVRDFTLINSASITWTGGTARFYGSTSAFINASGATFDDQIDGTFGSVDGNCIQFLNEGRFIKSGGTGITYLQMQLYNRGTVEIQHGQLYLGCGYVSSNPVDPIPPGIDYPLDHPPDIRIDDPIILPIDPLPVVIPGNYTQSVTGQLTEQIAGHTGTGKYGIPGTDYGQLVVNGDVALNGTFEVQVLGDFVPTIGQQYMAIDNRGSHAIDGTFISLPEGSVIWAGNYGFLVTYFGGDGNDFVLIMSQFANTPPVANAGGPYTIDEGGIVALSGAGSYDAQQTTESLIYAWDLDGDGIFGESGAAAGRGDENVMNPVFSAAGLNGPSTYTVSLRVTDEYGAISEASTTINVLNVAPTVTLTGPTTAYAGQTKHYTFSATDPGTDTFSIVATSGGSVGTVTNIVFNSVTGAGSFDVTFSNGPASSVVSVLLKDSDGANSNVSTVTVTIAPLFTLSGLVFSDFNNDGEVNFGEKAIQGVVVTLSNEFGTDVATTTTNAQGIYEFTGLVSGQYYITEQQPTGYTQGTNKVGTLGGTVSAVDQFFVDFANAGSSFDGLNYNFPERPNANGKVQSGQTAGIGFWQNKNGQALILALNGGANSTQLGNWLAATFPNMYGVNAGTSNLTGRTNAQVAAFYVSLFKRNGQTAPAGPPKVGAQVLATALAVYVTNSSLSGNVATSYGFQVSTNGVGYAAFNVTTNGAAFGVANGSCATIMDLLLAVNARTRRGLLFDTDDSGTISTSERAFREMANTIFSGINEMGDL